MVPQTSPSPKKLVANPLSVRLNDTMKSENFAVKRPNKKKRLQKKIIISFSCSAPTFQHSQFGILLLRCDAISFLSSLLVRPVDGVVGSPDNGGKIALILAMMASHSGDASACWLRDIKLSRFFSCFNDGDHCHWNYDKCNSCGGMSWWTCEVLKTGKDINLLQKLLLMVLEGLKSLK